MAAIKIASKFERIRTGRNAHRRIFSRKAPTHKEILIPDLDAQCLLSRRVQTRDSKRQNQVENHGGAKKKKYQQDLKTYRKTEAVSGEVLHDSSWMMLRMFATGQIHCVHQFHLMLSGGSSMSLNSMYITILLKLSNSLRL